MADGDVEALYGSTGAEDPADDLAVFVQQVCGTAPGRAGLAVLTSQATLGAAYAGQSGKDAHVAGQARTARMSFPLSVEDYQLRSAAQLLQSPQDYRGLAKTQQAGNVREIKVGPGVLLLNYSQALPGTRSLLAQPRILQLQQYDGGDDLVFRRGNSSVNAGDQTDGPTKGPLYYSRTDLLLKADGLGGTDFPRVMKTP